jgi:hypothetical protein
MTSGVGLIVTCAIRQNPSAADERDPLVGAEFAQAVRAKGFGYG